MIDDSILYKPRENMLNYDAPNTKMFTFRDKCATFSGDSLIVLIVIISGKLKEL